MSLILQLDSFPQPKTLGGSGEEEDVTTPVLIPANTITMIVNPVVGAADTMSRKETRVHQGREFIRARYSMDDWALYFTERAIGDLSNEQGVLDLTEWLKEIEEAS